MWSAYVSGLLCLIEILLRPDYTLCVEHLIADPYYSNTTNSLSNATSTNLTTYNNHSIPYDVENRTIDTPKTNSSSNTPIETVLYTEEESIATTVSSSTSTDNPGAVSSNLAFDDTEYVVKLNTPPPVYTSSTTQRTIHPTPTLPLFVPADQLRDGQIFSGEVSSNDHFRVSHYSDNSVLVGARNVIYNISLETLTENTKITWSPSTDDLQYCGNLQKSDEECQNYIRVITQTDTGHYLACGTNAFRPKCRHYQLTDDFGYRNVLNESGVGKCPFDPRHNNTALYTGGRFYTATVADTTARTSVIYSNGTKTVQGDSQWLNEPDFVSSLEYEDKVYFFFRESAVEYINCGKAVYSRVARVCKNDVGGAHLLRNTWTSYFKSRLNCSVPGQFPFYFDEIQATSGVGKGNIHPTLAWSDRTSLVYGIFNTPQNSIPGSAVCAFTMSDIVRTFEGPFKEQSSPTSIWLPTTHPTNPANSCANDSKTIPMLTLSFIKTHPLMDRAVPAAGGHPILVQASFGSHRMTAIVVDWQYRAADKRYYDILFVGTENGHILKAINRGRTNKIDTVIVEDLQLFDPPQAVTSVKIYRNEDQEKLIVITGDEIKSVALQRCHRHLTCTACVAAQDPYCAWTGSECANTNQGGSIQNLETGRHSGCGLDQPLPPADPSVSMTTTRTEEPVAMPTCPPCVCATPDTRTNTTDAGRMAEEKEERDNRISQVAQEGCVGASLEESGSEYSPHTLAVSITVATILSLIVGFLFGYGFSVYRNKQEPEIPPTFPPSNPEKVQNTYEVGPSNQAPRNDTVTPPAVVGEKQLNVVYNPLKEDKSKTPNGSVETTVNGPKTRKSYI